MSTKQPFSTEEHKRLGQILKVFRNEHLIKMQCDLANRYPRSKADRLVRKTMKALDELRWEMENVLWNDISPAETMPDGTPIQNVYLGKTP
jgi:hypothetical protein